MAWRLRVFQQNQKDVPQNETRFSISSRLHNANGIINGRFRWTDLDFL